MNCGCQIHDGETHAEHMRRLELRMAKDKIHRIYGGVSRTVAKVRAGEPVTDWEANALRHAVIAVDAVRRDLYIHLTDIDRYWAS